MAEEKRSRVVRFGVFEVDADRRELRKNGLRVKLQDQPFQLLLALLQRPGELVTREELCCKLWPDGTFVDFEHSLGTALKKIRDVLGDSATEPRFIETLPKHGYRWIAPLLLPTGSREAQRSDKPKKRPRRIALEVALGCAVALVAGAFLLRLNGPVSRNRSASADSVAPIHSLAVLPLANLSGEPALESFSDGMTDALITNLAQIGWVRVVSRTSSMHYKRTDKTLPEIAHELNADGIVEGTVQRADKRVRITVQLIYAPSDRHLWANTYEQDMGDILALEQQLAQEIAGRVQARLNAEERPQPGAYLTEAAPRPAVLQPIEAWFKDRAASFDGIHSFVNIHDTPALRAITSAVTVAAWINPQRPPEKFGWILGRRNPFVTEAFSLEINNEGLLATTLQTNVPSYIASAVPVIPFNGQWQHVAMTADTDTGQVHLYVNGQAVPLQVLGGSETVSGTFADVNHIFIGQRQSSKTPERALGAAHFKGLIADLEVYNRALSPGEIQTIVSASHRTTRQITTR